jgi:hypothetical protein
MVDSPAQRLLDEQMHLRINSGFAVVLGSLSRRQFNVVRLLQTQQQITGSVFFGFAVGLTPIRVRA